MKRYLWFALMIGLLAGLPTCAAAQTEPLYAGTSYPGMVYQYHGGATWEAISPILGDAVLCLAEYEGSLYAGTVASEGSEGVDYSGGRVYRYDGSGEWTVVGDNMDLEVSALVVHHGQLYAATSWWGGNLYRYDGGTTWAWVVDAPGWDGVSAVWVHTDGHLYLGDCHWDYLGRYQGGDFLLLANLSGGGVWDFSAYSSLLYAATYLGRMYRSADGLEWEMVLDYDEQHLVNLWELEQFDGFLFLGDDGGRLRRMDRAATTYLVWTAPTSLIAMVANGRDGLYLGTGTEVHGGEGAPGGVVYRYDGTGDPQPISGVLGEGVQCLFLPYTFPDVRREHWAYEEIEGCREGGLLGGYPDGHFNPTWAVNRAQMAVFISRALLGGDEHVPDGPATPSFTDVGTDYWAYKYIESTVDNSIAQGFGDGTFHPEYLVNREQMAVFIARAMSGGIGHVPDEPCTEDPFPDLPCDYWARPDIQYLVSQGVCGGYPDGNFHPTNVCSRDQITVFLARAFGLGG